MGPLQAGTLKDAPEALQRKGIDGPRPLPCQEFWTRLVYYGLRDAAPKLLRFRLLHLPARLTRGQRKRWLHLRADWPWTRDLVNAWNAVKAIPAPT